MFPHCTITYLPSGLSKMCCYRAHCWTTSAVGAVKYCRNLYMNSKKKKLLHMSNWNFLLTCHDDALHCKFLEY